MTVNSYFSATINTTAQILNTGTVSEDVNLGGLRAFAIKTPEAVTGANLTFQVSDDGVNWLSLVNGVGGAAITVPMAADQAISLGDLFQHFAPWQHLRLVSDLAEGADRDFEIIARHV